MPLRMLLDADQSNVSFNFYMLSPEFVTFHANWRAKADAYANGTLGGAFDRFFTLFVIYNRLYAEATFNLARSGQLKLGNRTSFPDRAGATGHVAQFLGAEAVIESLESKPESAAAIQSVIALLSGPVGGHRFAVRLDMIYGNPQPAADLELLNKFRSQSRGERGLAVLEFLYAVRCNLFHGHKSFEPVQIEIMRPANVLLDCIIELLFSRLNT